MSEVHAETVPFVRETMLPSAAPPARQSGPLHTETRYRFTGKPIAQSGAARSPACIRRIIAAMLASSAITYGCASR